MIHHPLNYNDQDDEHRDLLAQSVERWLHRAAHHLNGGRYDYHDAEPESSRLKLCGLCVLHQGHCYNCPLGRIDQHDTLNCSHYGRWQSAVDHDDPLEITTYWALRVLWDILTTVHKNVPVPTFTLELQRPSTWPEDLIEPSIYRPEDREALAHSLLKWGNRLALSIRTPHNTPSSTFIEVFTARDKDLKDPENCGFCQLSFRYGNQDNCVGCALRRTTYGLNDTASICTRYSDWNSALAHRSQPEARAAALQITSDITIEILRLHTRQQQIPHFYNHPAFDFDFTT